MTLGAPERGYWAASCVSTIHAVLLSAFCYHAATSGQIWDKWDFFLATPESTFCICVFCGYLCCDLCIALYYREAWAGWKMNIAHHIVVILSLVQMLSGVGSGHATYGHCFAMSAGMTELTTPFVNNRWFMDQMGMKSSPVFVVNGVIMLLGWFAVRVVYFIYVGTKLFTMKDQIMSLQWVFMLTFVGNYSIALIMQLVWFRKIAWGAFKVIGLVGGEKAEIQKDPLKKG